jgi:hypothetical protein
LLFGGCARVKAVFCRLLLLLLLLLLCASRRGNLVQHHLELNLPGVGRGHVQAAVALFQLEELIFLLLASALEVEHFLARQLLRLELLLQGF